MHLDGVIEMRRSWVPDPGGGKAFRSLAGGGGARGAGHPGEAKAPFPEPVTGQPRRQFTLNDILIKPQIASGLTNPL